MNSDPLTLFQILSLIINSVVAIAGFSAIVIYFVQKLERKRTAATLLIAQINHIEEVVNNLRSHDLLTDEIIYQSKVILSENYWEKCRHLLSKRLGSNNVKLLEKFYGQAEELEKSRKEICCELVTAWEHKNLVLQNRIANLSFMSEDQRIAKMKQLNGNFEQCSKIFIPDLPIKILLNNLSVFRPLSGTTLYDTLWKISYHV